VPRVTPSGRLAVPPCSRARPPHDLGGARRGSAELGWARRGSAGLGGARRGSAGLGGARRGSAGLGSAGLGSARFGSAGCGSFGAAPRRAGRFRLRQSWSEPFQKICTHLGHRRAPCRLFTRRHWFTSATPSRSCVPVSTIASTDVQVSCQRELVSVYSSASVCFSLLRSTVSVVAKTQRPLPLRDAVRHH
jgi:hypothetical protein